MHKVIGFIAKFNYVWILLKGGREIFNFIYFISFPFRNLFPKFRMPYITSDTIPPNFPEAITAVSST